MTPSPASSPSDRRFRWTLGACALAVALMVSLLSLTAGLGPFAGFSASPRAGG